MKELFTEIEQLVPKCGDWCSQKKAAALAAAVLALRPKVIVEIGVFSGASFLPMALACKELGTGLCYAIDPWNKIASMEGMSPDNAVWWGNVDHLAIYEDFMARVKKMKLEKHVRVIRAKSNDVQPPRDIGIFHLDGNHGEQAIRDVDRFAPNVIVGGLVWLDDMNWEGGSVQRASEALIKMGFVRLYDQDTGAVFQRISK